MYVCVPMPSKVLISSCVPQICFLMAIHKHGHLIYQEMETRYKILSPNCGCGGLVLAGTWVYRLFVMML